MPPPSMVLQLPRLGRFAGVTAAPAFQDGARNLNSHGCHSSRRSSSSSSRSSSWFSSNAENPGPDTRDDNRTSSRRWWSDDQFDVEEEEEEEFGSEGSFGSAREMFDEPWFTKVFRVYGYVLPVLLASMLVTTGPQAFLMAMAIPLAQSVLSFAISKIGSFGRRRRDEEEYDDDGYYYSDYGSGGWEAEEQYSSNSSTYRGDSSTSSSRYQQQQQEESADSDPTVESGDIDGTTGAAARSESGNIGFGGWDELEEGDDRRRSSRWRARASPADTATAGGAVRTSRPPATRRRRSRGAAAARYRQAPLPMRLLVALFPFLGSWFRILL
ncbi:hypothetical protein VPH35_009032 [Triticum aestivum]|uniref:Uncharacterized protein n=3 Tax=Triticum TaxID=4564 RepID=A0A9R0VAV8_TRITD|nr:uncharacterized protein LOC123129997 [Triticum aestivum]VAH18528.1 unnamed protein product [Triticum turgidum subsp. durum]